MAEAVVSIVVGRLTDLLSEEAQVLYGVKDEIQQVVTELMRMKTFLPDADSRLSDYSIRDLDTDKVRELRNLLVDVRELAYDAEHVVETFLVKVLSSTGKTRQWINTVKFSRKIRDIQRRISILFNRFPDHNIKPTSESSESIALVPKKLERFYSYPILEPEIFVGFHGDVDLLIGHLVNESDDCYKLVSICGMGGLGKTTLAKKIYNHSTIKTCFARCLAWVTVSRTCQRKQVLQKVLKCLVPEEANEILTYNDDKLVQNLIQIQQRKKCLIVLDDIWSTDAWDSLKVAFPTEKSVSKLMLTSRNVDVAEHANPKGFIHQPALLNPEQSWELLQLKAVPRREDCLDITRDPKRMEELGREMVVNCGGLPLAIEMLGGILVTKPSLIEWEKVYTDSLSYPKKGKGFGERYQTQLFNVLVWSYNDLPPQLKACFLYLGTYREDESIDAETLYQLWIAEGMVLSSDKREGETMMEVAESYLGELVHRSMVQVKFNDDKSSINFRSCSLHDLMRDLSISQAEAVEFFKVVDLREKNDSHLSPSVDSKSSNTRRLVVYFDEGHTDKKTYDYFGKKASPQRYRSMLLFDKFGTRILPPLLESHVANFKLLRVFSLEVEIGPEVLTAPFRINLGKELCSLVYLRYLCVSDANLSIFPSIQKLVLLETLRFDRQFDIDFPSWLSENILGMLSRLRHLYLPSLGVQSQRKNFKLRFIGLSKLETLENFDTNWCEVKDLPELKSLRKLTLSAKGSHYDMQEMMENLAAIAFSPSSCLRYLELTITARDQGLRNGLDMLRQLFGNHNFNLQVLTLTGELPELAQIFARRPQQFPNIDVSQTRITRLRLWMCHLEEDPMPVLEKIATLRDLYLHMYTFMGKEMICSANGFQKLTGLTLELLPNLEKWRVEEGSMPVLSQLIFICCPKFEELPEGLVFLNSLQTLGLCAMSLELCDKLHRDVNGEQGAEFYKVAHIPSLRILHTE